MPRRGRKVKTYKELNEELNKLLNDEKVASQETTDIKARLQATDINIENLKRDIIDLKTKRTVTIAELDGQIKHKKNELLKTQKLRRSIVYEHGRSVERHKSLQRSITRRHNEIEERKTKFAEKMQAQEEKKIAPPTGLEGIGALEIKDNNGDGS